MTMTSRRLWWWDGNSLHDLDVWKAVWDSLPERQSHYHPSFVTALCPTNRHPAAVYYEGPENSGVLYPFWVGALKSLDFCPQDLQGGCDLVSPSSQMLPEIKLPRAWNKFLSKRVVGMLLKGEYLKLNRADEVEYQFYLRLLREAEASCNAKIDIADISELTKKLLNKFDWEAIRQSRRSGYQYLASSLSEIDAVELLFPDLPEGICPIGFPMIVNSPETRDRLRKFLVQHGVYPPVHWELPLEVKEQEFSESWDLSRRILTIPIDQRYSKIEMDYISDVLRNFERELQYSKR